MLEETEAWYEFDRQVRNDPPWRPDLRRLDRAMALIPARGQVQLAIAHGKVIGKAVVGEIGIAAPNATTRHFDDDSALILFNSGLFEFIEAVVNTSMSAAKVHGNEDVAETALKPEQVDQRLLDIYAAWPAFWKQERFSYQPVELPGAAQAIASEFVDACTLFLLLHEYGHAVLHRGVELSERQPHHEFEADRWALDAMVDYYGHPTGRFRTGLVGSIIAIRAWSALEAIGHKFPGEYPPPSERYDAVMAAFRERCGRDDYTYYLFSTIAVAHDQRMEATERAFRGLPYKPPVVVENFLSTAMSMLVELQKGSLEQKVVEDELRGMLAELDNEAITSILAAARTVFNADAPSYGQSFGPGVQTSFIVDRFWSIVTSILPDRTIEKPAGVH